MTIPETFQWALGRHEAGMLTEADALYRQILSAQPNHADAMHLLGVIAHQTGRHDLAVGWIRRAITVNPAGLHYYLNLGNALAARGDANEAIATYRRALEIKPGYSEAHNNLGVALAAQGRLDEAFAFYRRALELKPDYPEAHNNLGNALRDRGRFVEAAAACRSALALRPDYSEAYNNLGAALAAQGQFDEAIAAYRRALELRPSYPEAHNNLGVALAGRGDLNEAATAHRQALQLRPDYPEAHNNLGAALAGLGRLEDAISAHRRALELRPDYPEASNNLGNALRERGQPDEAVSAYRHALQCKQDLPETWNNLGIVLGERREFEESISAFRRALELKPEYAEAHNNLGNALAGQGRYAEAITVYRRALQIKPDYPDVYNNLGRALRMLRHFDDAVAAYRHALELKPDFVEAMNNLGHALGCLGLIDEALGMFRRALELKPEYAWVHSNLIYTLHFHPGHGAGAILEEQERWNQRFSEPLRPLILTHANDRNPERRLRIGYVSPDFWDHAISRFALPLFEQHNRKQFEIICYSDVPRPDSMTERFHALADQWRNTIGVSDSRLAEMVREDKVDILVDLAMHTANNRLPMFARQPAPVQVSWLAYPGGAGLHGIGYRLTDAHMDHPADEPPFPAEHLVRLSDCWCCYRPPDDFPEVNDLPALSTKIVTFGSLNNFSKLNERVLALWARILETINESRLLILCPPGSARERLRAFFAARGIAAERVEFADYLPYREYLRLYQRIDLALDPFPCNGMTTTCDALWMGAPVLTLCGETPVSRAGLSLLSNVGLTELVAASEERYLQIAVELAGNLSRLAELRATLRARMQSSPLMDAPRFARKFEEACRFMWERWRAG